MATEAKKQRAGARPQALITGASTGIGAAFAEHLAHDGHDVIIVARSRPRLETLAERLHKAHGVTVKVVAADLTDADGLRGVERVVHDAELDLLVNNAGFGTVGGFAALGVATEEEEIRLNVLALMRLTHAALAGMIKRRRGAIINVSSLAAFQPMAFNATYAATKAFVNSFTESLHEELRGTGVRVQALCPGFTRTEFQERAGVNTADVPSFAWMSPEAVAEASLHALRRGDVICIPGLANRAVATVVGVLPRRVTRRVSGILGKRTQS
jgi:uncharacterized protein